MMQTGTKAVQGGGWETAHFHQAFPETTAASGVAVMSQLQTTNVRGCFLDSIALGVWLT